MGELRSEDNYEITTISNITDEQQVGQKLETDRVKSAVHIPTAPGWKSIEASDYRGFKPRK